MGGAQALNEIADYNQDVGRICNYCLEAVSTSEHVRWECKRFDATRNEIDAEPAAIPRKYIPNRVKNGIAPAMKAERKNFLGNRARRRHQQKKQEVTWRKP